MAMKEKIVRISIEGGVIQEVECPKGVQVIVHNYDIDGSEEDLNEDDNGEFVETIWEN
jgi:hypothetical protein